jgi:hypothetical protein
MTTIAYREGVLAGDSRAYSGGSTPIGTKQKIFQFDDGTMCGISTMMPGLSEQVAHWIGTGMDRDHLPDQHQPNLTVLLVDPDGQVYIAIDSYHFTGPLEGSYFAIGSGDHYALGAMAMGADACRAVEVACDLDVWTGGTVRSIHQNAQLKDAA